MSRDGTLERPPLAPKLIRRPPVPARVGELAPGDLALVESGDRRDSMVGIIIIFQCFRVSLFLAKRGPLVMSAGTFCEGSLTCA